MEMGLNFFRLSLETEPYSLGQRVSEIFINKSNMILKEVMPSIPDQDYRGKIALF